MAFSTTVVRGLPQSQRVRRSPSHSWNIRTKPWAITPVCIAPVLPGETLDNLLFQVRAITDPLKSRLIGWHCEYYWFYVKHTDLANADDFRSMHLQQGYDLSSLYEATNLNWHHVAAGVNWVKMCVQRIVECYFRDEGEAWDDYLWDDYPLASIGKNSIIDSLMTDASWVVDDVTVSGDTVVTASEVDTAMRTWEWLRAQNLTTLTYEEYLQTFGVRTPAANDQKPELIRFVREWQYPTNAVDAATGTVNSVCSWAIAERADKQRFFTEPGFLVGVTVARPKIYYSGQTGSAVWAMKDALSWLPAMMHTDQISSFTKISQTAGPFASVSDDYWVDVRDILIYGDQFRNYAIDNLVALPNAGLTNKRYAGSADADFDAIFETATATAEQYVYHDGIAHFNIRGRQRDTSPSVSLRAA